ncbi:NfeD family protein [Bremerella sp.]|uniref:NfeD family protein n=1 Tax=Bremerella sp. TaxID=2795602 RepID=UPI00391A82BE
MSPITIALILLLSGLALIVLELFIPSGGVLGFIAAVLLVSAVVYAYWKCDIAVGTAFLAAAVITVPVMIGIAIRIWPHTPMGRMILLDSATEEYVDSHASSGHTELVGRRGIARSNLLPSGVAEIDGNRWDVIIVGPAADRGDLIEVVEVEGNRILVARVDETNDAPAPAAEHAAAESLTTRNDEIFEDDPFA